MSESSPTNYNKEVICRHVRKLREKGVSDSNIVDALIKLATEALDHRDIWSAWAKDQYGLPLPWEKLKWEKEDNE